MWNGWARDDLRTWWRWKSISHDGYPEQLAPDRTVGAGPVRGGRRPRLAVQTSLGRALLVSILPVIFIVVGYWGWAVSELNCQPSWLETFRTLRVGLSCFGTGVGVLRLVALSPWFLVGPAGMGGCADGESGTA